MLNGLIVCKLAALLLLYPLYSFAQVRAPAELVGAGTVSTNDVFGGGYGPDEQEVYFVKAHNKRELLELWSSHQLGGRWQPAQRIPWTLPGDIDPALSPDGQRMYFNRRANPAIPASLDIWQSQRSPDGSWASPQPVPGLANSDSAEIYASATHSYDLYFGSNRGGNPDIYLARFINGSYDAPQKLPDNINTPDRESNPFISADESYLVFYRSPVGARSGSAVLMYALHNSDGSWADPVAFPAPADKGFCPYVSRDGEWLYFSYVEFDNAGPRSVVRHENLYRIRVADIGVNLPAVKPR
jgi:WD40-like Beta Propeller Repeat